MYQPQVILQCLSTQATYINNKYGQMFYYTDLAQLFADLNNGARKQLTDVKILQFERERANFVPSKLNTQTEPSALTNDQIYLNGQYVYVVETNSLYFYQYASRTWYTVYGTYGQTTVAQTYLPNGDAVAINADDVTTNGILNDGSVVIRDSNKMICGLLKSDGYSFYIQSLIGGQINLDPSGIFNGSGCLQLNSGRDNNQQQANLNSDLVVFGNLKTTSKDNWKKQYRLVTENIKLNSVSLIKKGSTILKNSQIGSTKYLQDTVLTEDVNDDGSVEGLLVTGCKLYIDSIINNNKLQPPYAFDIADYSISTYSSSYDIADSDWGIQGDEDGENQSIMISLNSPFKNSGDCCYLKLNEYSGLNLSKIVGVSFLDNYYDVDAIYDVGNIGSVVCVKYYAQNNTVKILP